MCATPRARTAQHARPWEHRPHFGIPQTPFDDTRTRFDDVVFDSTGAHLLMMERLGCPHDGPRNLVAHALEEHTNHVQADYESHARVWVDEQVTAITWFNSYGPALDEWFDRRVVPRLLPNALESMTQAEYHGRASGISRVGDESVLLVGWTGTIKHSGSDWQPADTFVELSDLQWDQHQVSPSRAHVCVTGWPHDYRTQIIDYVGGMRRADGGWDRVPLEPAPVPQYPTDDRDCAFTADETHVAFAGQIFAISDGGRKS